MSRLQRAALSMIAAASCAHPPARGVNDTAPIAAAVSPECIALADSVQANTPVSKLTLAPAPPRLAMPRPPRDVRPGAPIHIVFRIRADGQLDLPTLAIRGTTDPSYRQSVERFLNGARFRVPELRGCPVPGRGEFVLAGG